MKGGLWYELKKNNILKYSVRKTAFLSSSVYDDKKLTLPKTTVPAPGHYDVEVIIYLYTF